MKLYYSSGSISLYCGDCREMASFNRVVVTDPPYNVGYHYEVYGDRLSVDEYLKLLSSVASSPSVFIHYPEDMFSISSALGCIPNKCVAWVYNANTPKQWRMVSWFGVSPDFSKVRQPYKNPKDKRIRALIAKGSEGTKLYDWWNVQQVKNTSKDKTAHPCQIPLEVMRNVLAITPADTIYDPFCGSGTTLVAAKLLGRSAVGVELDEKYCEIAARRLESFLATEEAA